LVKLVKIQFDKCEYGYIKAEFTDHAGDSLVCASISGLGMALVGTLNRVEDINFAYCNYGKGNISLMVHPFQDAEKQQIVDTIFETIYVGVSQIEKKYPNNVKVMLIEE